MLSAERGQRLSKMSFEKVVSVGVGEELLLKDQCTTSYLTFTAALTLRASGD